MTFFQRYGKIALSFQFSYGVRREFHLFSIKIPGISHVAKYACMGNDCNNTKCEAIDFY